VRLLTRALTACALFSVVEYAYWTAVLLYAYQVGGPTLAGLVLLIQLVPAAALATPLGIVGDRLPRGVALSGAYALQGLALLVLAWLLWLDAGLFWIVTASTVATVLVSVARPIHNAALPQLSPTPKALVRANAFTGIADGVGVFVGPIVAGVLVQRNGYAIVPLLCALAMLVAATLTARLGLPVVSADDANADEDDSWLAGVRAVRRDPAVFLLVLMVGVSFIVVGSLEVMGVAFATDRLDGDASVQGLMIGAEGIGTFIGSLAAAGLAVRARLSPIIVAALVASGIPLVFMALTQAIAPALLWLAICGVGLAVSSVAVRTLLQRSTDAHLLARVFAVQESLAMLGLAIGAIIGPLCVVWFGAAGAYVPLGIGLVVFALAAAPVLRRLDRRVVSRPDVMALMRGVPFLAALRPPAIERLSQRAEWIDVAEGTVVITQGDRGDAFYIVDQGRLSVVKDGQRLPYDMDSGDGFGELALLRDVPRSTTITALVPCRLLRVERDEFLAAVTGVADGQEIARQVAEAFEARARAASGD
jgi:CRP-like cAMP-binding protein